MEISIIWIKTLAFDEPLEIEPLAGKRMFAPIFLVEEREVGTVYVGGVFAVIEEV